MSHVEGAAVFLFFGVAIALCLFLVRKFARSLYGLVEVLSGLLLLYLSYGITGGDSSDDMSHSFFRIQGRHRGDRNLGRHFCDCSRVRQYRPRAACQTEKPRPVV
jgi:hypothetical protein